MGKNRKLRATNAYKARRKYEVLAGAPEAKELTVDRIGKKTVISFDSHEKAALAWKIIAKASFKPFFIITLDHHTDTLEAFHVHSCIHSQNDEVVYGALRNELIEAMKTSTIPQLQELITKLQNDEHIEASILAGTISAAYCHQFSDGGNLYLEQPPINKIIAVPFDCYIGCKESTHNDECMSKQYSHAIESTYLNDQIQRAKQIAKRHKLPHTQSFPYVLDIDLDYFHSKDALKPNDSSTFYDLINNAIAITIAKEPEYVADGLEDGENITSDEIFEVIISHIREAQFKATKKQKKKTI